MIAMVGFCCRDFWAAFIGFNQGPYNDHNTALGNGLREASCYTDPLSISPQRGHEDMSEVNRDCFLWTWIGRAKSAQVLRELPIPRHQVHLQNTIRYHAWAVFRHLGLGQS